MTQRVLLCAPQDGATVAYIEHAFLSLGWDVRQFDYRQIAILKGREYLGEAIEKSSNDCDAVLVLKGETIQPTTLRRLGRRGVSTLVWMVDPRDGQQPWVRNMAISSDHFFTTARGLLPFYRMHGVDAHWLLEGCDPDIHQPMAPDPEETLMPISFAGTVAGVPHREEWLMAIRGAYGDGLHVFGSFPGALSGWRGHHGRAEEYSGLRGDYGLNWVTSRTKVNLGHDRNPEIDGSYSARLFRTLAAGGFLLTNHTQGIDKDFPGCVGLYETTQDCMRQIDRYLHNDPLRREMAERGRKLVLEQHTFKHRIEEMLQVVGLN